MAHYLKFAAGVVVVLAVVKLLVRFVPTLAEYI